MYLGAIEGYIHSEQLIHIQHALRHIQTIHRVKAEKESKTIHLLNLHIRFIDDSFIHFTSLDSFSQ